LDNGNRGFTYAKKKQKRLPTMTKEEKKKLTEKPKRTYEVVWEF
jgi:hypothetical protein